MVQKSFSPARAGLGLAAVAAGLLAGCAAPLPAAQCAVDDIAYVGTDGAQLSALRIDSCAGKLSMLGAVSEVAKPRWTVSYPSKPAQPVLYAALDAGSVAAFTVDRKSATLKPLGESSANGSGTTHLLFDAP